MVQFSADTGITPFWQKANIIVTRVKIMITFCVVQNGIQIYNLVRKLTDFCEKFSLLFLEFCSSRNHIIILTLVTIKSAFCLTQNGVMLSVRSQASSCTCTSLNVEVELSQAQDIVTYKQTQKLKLWDVWIEWIFPCAALCVNFF